MSSILETLQNQKSMSDIKAALQQIGVDTTSVDSLEDVASVIRQDCTTGPNAVINAKLTSGPGIKIVPQDRKGYKISATSNAALTEDLSDSYLKGDSIQKVLSGILNKDIPAGVELATKTSPIVDAEFIKAPYDGVDYYENTAFGSKGVGRKSGLHPGSWYLKITLRAQREPMYIATDGLVFDIQKSIMGEVHHMVEHMIHHAFAEYDLKPTPHPVFPPCPHEPCDCIDADDWAASCDEDSDLDDNKTNTDDSKKDNNQGPWTPDECPVCNDGASEKESDDSKKDDTKEEDNTCKCRHHHHPYPPAADNKSLDDLINSLK